MTVCAHWSLAYLGLPWRDHGRDHDGVDCWGLVRLVYRERWGLDLDGYDGVYASAGEVAAIDAAIRTAAVSPTWMRIDRPIEGDVALYRRGRAEAHVGLVIGERLLHAVEPFGVRLELLATPRLACRLVGYHRHAGRL